MVNRKLPRKNQKHKSRSKEICLKIIDEVELRYFYCKLILFTKILHNIEWQLIYSSRFVEKHSRFFLVSILSLIFGLPIVGLSQEFNNRGLISDSNPETSPSPSLVDLAELEGLFRLNTDTIIDSKDINLTSSISNTYEEETRQHLNLSHTLFGDINSPGVIAIGLAEGNRDINGNPTLNYWRHIDPGNGQVNVGTFSCQPNTCSNRTPEGSDIEYLYNNLLPTVTQFEASHPWLTPRQLVTLADLNVQAPLTIQGDRFIYLYAYFRNEKGLSESEALLEARVASFYNPRTGRLEAGGFNNNLYRLRLDQERRQNALFQVIK